MVDSYTLALVGFGLLVLLTAWLPMVLSEAPLSLPIICVAVGALLFWFFKIPVPGLPDNPQYVERITEVILIIALMGAGLKIDRKFGWRSWSLTWRLLIIAMPLTIITLTFFGTMVLGLALAPALLLASALAPTDPVLASDVQVGPPKSGEEDETRFALTSEAGLNDGLAFPFVMCAIALAEAAKNDSSWFADWFELEVVWRISVGIIMGVGLGYSLGWLVFKMPNRAKLSRTGDGFVALGVTAIVYGLTESVHGYGFIAVFCAALALRAAERNHKYHVTLHDFAEQLERLLMMIVLVLFGGALVSGGLLNGLGWAAVGFAALTLLLVRPASAWLSLLWTKSSYGERAAISFFGIRGVGSIYYLAYALQKQTFEKSDLIWSVTSLIVLISIILHGVTVTPVMQYIDRLREK